jgi:hypothetical protein
MEYISRSAGDSFYLYQVNNLNRDLTYPLPAIGDYAAFYHYGFDTINDYTDNRIGLILKAKSTFSFDKVAQAAFGKENDTCFMKYKSKVENVRHGRSATMPFHNNILTTGVTQKVIITKKGCKTKPCIYSNARLINFFNHSDIKPSSCSPHPNESLYSENNFHCMQGMALLHENQKQDLPQQGCLFLHHQRNS